MLLLRLTRAQAFQFLLIVIALPSQYFLSKYTGNDNEVSRLTSINRLLTKVKEFEMPNMKEMLKLLIQKIKSVHISKKRKSQMKVEESVAVEVFKFQNNKGYFAAAPIVRTPRPKHLNFRLGQVLHHKKLGYLGVVIGWDESCIAPKDWINEQNFGRVEDWKLQPHYLLLTDGDKREYVSQDDLQLAKRHSGVKNSQILDYFDFFDGFLYHMRPAMRILYPED